MKVILPCVIEFQLAGAYLNSSGRPMNDQRMLRVVVMRAVSAKFPVACGGNERPYCVTCVRLAGEYKGAEEERRVIERDARLRARAQ